MTDLPAWLVTLGWFTVGAASVCFVGMVALVVYAARFILRVHRDIIRDNRTKR